MGQTTDIGVAKGGMQERNRTIQMRDHQENTNEKHTPISILRILDQFYKKSSHLGLLILGFLFALSAEARSYTYTLTWDNPREHYYQVEMEIEGANENFVRLQVPAWRPGRYYLQDYGAGIVNFKALSLEGEPLPWQREDGHTWLVKNGQSRNLKIRYSFYANTHDAGSSVLEKNMAYFNPVNFFMHARDLYAVPCTLKVPQLGNWKAATALRRDAVQKNVFYARDYHELVDSPTIFSPTLKTLHSRIQEVDYYFHFQGKFPNNKEVEDAVQMNLGKIIKEQMAIFGGAPMKEYHFIYLLSDKRMRHAVEHGNSAMFALPDYITKNPEAIRSLNGISAHEFFHLWNVKRIRPEELWPYDYQREQYTTLHWFTEGVTDYYAYLTLVRSGLVTREQFYKLLANNISALENNPASWRISPAEASFNSWLERSAYHPPYSRVSYYTLGTRIGLLLDLKMRAETKGKISLDDLFSDLNQNVFGENRGVAEEELQTRVETLTKGAFGEFFTSYVYGTEKIDYEAFFAPFGLYLDVYSREDRPWYKIGITRTSDSEVGLHIDGVIPGSDAARAGISAGDIITGINGDSISAFDSEDFFYAFREGKSFKAKVLTTGGSEEVEVKWTNRLDAREFKLSRLPKTSKKQDKMLEAWLKSRGE